MVTALTRLGSRRRQQIRALEERCMKHDNTVHRMYLDSDSNLYSGMKCFFIEETAAHGPRAVLSVTNMEPETAEITAFTDPEFRGRGLFLKLFRAAAEELKLYGVRRFYFVHEPACEDGKSVLKKMRCRLSKSEYLMKKDLTEPLTAEISGGGFGGTEETFRLMQAQPSDIPALALLLEECFDMDEQSAEYRLSEFLQSSGEREGMEDYYVWRVLLSGNTAGMCACCIDGGCASLFDICVAKAYRRLGIGTKLINGVLAALKEAGVKSVILQVSGSAGEAVTLYRKLGFVQTDRLDYYSSGSIMTARRS